MIGWLWSISWLWGIGRLQLQGVSIVDLLADLLGEGELNSLAVWGTQSTHTLVNGL